MFNTDSKLKRSVFLAVLVNSAITLLNIGAVPASASPLNMSVGGHSHNFSGHGAHFFIPGAFVGHHVPHCAPPLFINGVPFVNPSFCANPALGVTPVAVPRIPFSIQPNSGVSQDPLRGVREYGTLRKSASTSEGGVVNADVKGELIRTTR